MMTIPPGLRACWHPVAFSRQVTNAPHATKLLNEQLVLWCTEDGALHALSDFCIHRGTALSLGWTTGQELVCPYHGWRFGVDGRCTLIPQSPNPTHIPAKARVPSYPCTEQYGIVWVALEEPRYPLPVIPELTSPAWHVVTIGPYTWNCDASRMVENLTDIAHFPWVHPGLLGDRDRPEVADHKVERTGNLLTYSLARPVAPNPKEFQVFADREEKPVRHSSYELYLPYTLLQRSNWGAVEKLNYFFTCQPQSPNQCTAYGLIARTYNLDQPDSVMQAFEEVLFNQDRPVIESQRPEQVPFDLAAELHLKFDAVAVAYRRAMQAEGLAYGPTGAVVD